MFLMRFIFLIICLSLPFIAYAFPTKPIIIYVPFPSGGTSEQLARTVAEQVTEDTGIKFIIQTNTTNLSATDFINKYKTVPNDGHHLIFGNVGTHASSIALDEASILYDPVNDFIPVAMLGRTPLVVALRPNFPANNFKEFWNMPVKNLRRVFHLRIQVMGQQRIWQDYIYLRS